VPPGAALTLVAAGTEPLTLVSAQCPDPGPELRLEPALLSSDRGTTVGATARLWERESRPSGDRWYRVLIDEALGSRQVTQFVGAIPPGRAPAHFHEYEEVLCFLAGEGRLWADDVAVTIRELDLERPVISGWSYGPLVILDYVRHFGEEAIGGIHFVGGISKLSVEIDP